MEYASVARLVFSAAERQKGLPLPATLMAATEAIRRSGVVVLENLFAPEFIHAVHADFMQRYTKYFVDDLYDDVQHVGNKRMVVPVEIAGIYNQPYLYGNTLYYSLLEELLGPKFIMGGFGAVISLPGAEAQHIHRDHPLLFHDVGVGHVTPCFAITLVIPLVEMNEITGRTRFYPGTHKINNNATPKVGMVDPTAPIGSCVLWDYRILHGGLPNLSDQIRPIMYFTFCRPWFRDSANYMRQRPISLCDAEYEKIPMAYQHLFDWVRPQHSLDLERLPPDFPCPCCSGKAVKDCHGRTMMTD